MNKRISLIFLAFVIAGCSTSINNPKNTNKVDSSLNNTSKVMANHTFLTKTQIEELDKKYAFAIKDMSPGYIERMLTKLSTKFGGVLPPGKGLQNLFELEYLRIKQHATIKSVLENNPTLYNSLSSITEISSNTDAVFRSFFDVDCNPVKPPPSIITIAGVSGSILTYQDGNGTNARLKNPRGVAKDNNGNIYITDTGNGRIRKIDTSGNVSTIGNAGFSSSGDVAVDTSGNYYVTDGSNIKKIDTLGNVTTFASGFSFLRGIVRVSNGDFYVADPGDGRIKKITPTGTVTTFAGDGSSSFLDDPIGTNAKFNYPIDIAVDSNGNLFVTDNSNNKVRKITPSGAVTTFASGITYPQGIAIDTSDNLYVADYSYGIKKITPLGNVTTFAGGNGTGYLDGNGSNAQFSSPTGVEFSNGNIYVADWGNNRIRKIDMSANVTTVAGNDNSFLDGPANIAQFEQPSAVALDSSGNIYVTDKDNFRIRKIDTLLNVTTIAGSERSGFLDANGTNARFSQEILGIKVFNGNIYVTDTDNHRIRKIDASNNVTTIAGANPGYQDGNGINASFSYPRGIVLDSNGNFYISDLSNNRIRKIDTSFNVTTIAGDGSWDFLDANGTNAKFANPQCVARDNTGNLYVADAGNNKIRKIDTSNNVTTFAGSTGGFSDGTGTNAKFSYPISVTTDDNGNVYVSDMNNSKIRKITPVGVVTTIAGGSGEFSSPLGIAVSGDGSLIYVADTNNNRIRKITIY